MKTKTLTKIKMNVYTEEELKKKIDECFDDVHSELQPSILGDTSAVVGLEECKRKLFNLFLETNPKIVGNLLSIPIDTSMGQLTSSSRDKLSGILSKPEMEELDCIGYSGKKKNGQKCGRTEYLNSLGRGKFQINQTKYDSGDFSESFTLTYFGL